MISKAQLQQILKPLSDDQRKARDQKVIQDRLKACTKNSDGTYSSKGDVDLSSLELDRLPVKFKEVGGYFFCYGNKLTSLKGAPEKVGSDFQCDYNQLTTLEGSPKTVGGGFFCNYNQLTTLEGGPEKVNGGFSCQDNQLTSLKGAPEEVGGAFYCFNNPVSQEELEKTVTREYLK